MPNRSTDALFQLVKSMEKSEKRNFKLYVRRNSSSETLKTIQHFDELDKMNDFVEAADFAFVVGEAVEIVGSPVFRN